MIEQALIKYLTDQSAVAALVGKRVVLLAAAESVQRPLVVLFRTQTNRISSKTGPTGDVRATFEFHCLASDPSSMQDLGAAVTVALIGVAGDPGDASVGLGTLTAGVTISHLGISNEKDAYEPDAQLFVRIIEGFIWYSEKV